MDPAEGEAEQTSAMTAAVMKVKTMVTKKLVLKWSALDSSIDRLAMEHSPIRQVTASGDTDAVGDSHTTNEVKSR